MLAIFNTIETHFAEYKQLWIDISNIESISSDKERVDQVAEYIKRFCSSKGYKVREKVFEKAGNCLSISMNADSLLPGVALMAHMDTVHENGKFGYPPVKQDDEYLYGPGVYDCKGGIAVALLVMQVLKDAGYSKRPIKLILTGDEEVSNALSGSQGIDFICDEVRGYAAAFNCESGSEGAITVARKGILKLEIAVKGKAAHAGSNYSEGISAIKEAAHKIIDIEKASCQDNVTYNCGVIKGGEVVNIVPEHCSFEVDIRYINQDSLDAAMKHVEAIVNYPYIKGTSATITEKSRRLPMKLTEGNMKLYEHISKVCRKYDLEQVSPSLKGGGSDSAYTVLAGVPSVCSVGTTGEGAHTVFEKSRLDSLPSRAKMLTAAIIELPDDFVR